MNYLDKPKLAKLTSEIHWFNEQGIRVSIEVGRRLEDAKSEFDSADEWMTWAESQFRYKKSQAYKLVAIAKRFHSSGISIDGRSINELYALTAFDDDELQQPKQLVDGSEKKLVEMSQKEIEQYKRAKSEADRRAQESDEKAKRFEKELRERPQIEKPVPMPQDRARINELENSVRIANSQVDIYKRKAELNEKESKEYAELRKKIEFLHQQKDDIHRQIESATALSGMSVEIDNFLKTKLAPIRYSRALERLDSEVAARNLNDIILSVEHWCEDMRRYLPQNNRKIVEVIDYDHAG